jgi:hypothetical protein
VREASTLASITDAGREIAAATLALAPANA